MSERRHRLRSDHHPAATPVFIEPHHPPQGRRGRAVTVRISDAGLAAAEHGRFIELLAIGLERRDRRRRAVDFSREQSVHDDAIREA